MSDHASCTVVLS